MKTGKISESVLKRSVIKQINNRREEVERGAGVGTDCALFSFPYDNFAVLSVASAVIYGGEISAAVKAAINNIGAAGALPVAILVSLILPKEAYESDLKEYMAEIEKVCKELGIQIAGGNTEISREVQKPILSITALGRVSSVKVTCYPEEDVVLSKWIGLYGTALAASWKEAELLKRLPAHLIEEAQRFHSFVSILPEAEIARRLGVSKMHDVSRGGIFAALWELAEGAGVGLEIDLKKIPVKQETIEVCEALELNPYELHGAGALLMTCSNGHDLVRELEQHGIPAVVIGKIKRGKDRVILNEDEKRFLDRPKSDEIEKIK